MRKAWPTLAIAAIASTTRLASAEKLPLELDWQAPEGCPDSSAVRERIEQILRGPLTRPSSVVARGKITDTQRGKYRLAMTVRTGGVEDARDIDATSCVALAQAFSIVVALAIDPTRSGDGAEDPRGAESPPASHDEPPPGPPETPPERRPRTRRRPEPSAPERPPPPRIAIGLGASVDVGSLPNASPGVVATVALRLRRFRLGLVGIASLRQNPRFDGRAGASFDMLEGGAFAGYLFPLWIVDVGPAVDVEATYVRAEGFGIQTPSSSSAVWATVVAGARAETRLLPWLGLFARLDMLVPLGAPRFSLETSTDALRLHSAGPVSLRMSLGAEVVFP